MICVFSFLPETPLQDQAIYIIKAYHAATRVVTLFSGLADQRRIIAYPIYIRQPVSLAAFILFRLHLSPLLLPQYVESCRQSVVTVHRLYRNMLTAWKDVENDISRTAKVLEKLNFVIITHPELFTKAPGIITRMRSHLTASLFYELIWAIHEARRRGGIGSSSTHAAAFVAAAAAAAADPNSPKPNTPYFQPAPHSSAPGSHVTDSVPPLPFYNQITKDDFTTTTTTTPNGTTVTTLVPTNNSGAGAKSYQGSNNSSTPTQGLSQQAGAAPGQDFAGPLQTALSRLQSESRLGGGDARSPGRRDSKSGTNGGMLPPGLGNGHSNSNGTTNAGAEVETPNGTSNGIIPFYDSTGSSTDPLHLDTLIQGIDWMDPKGDDLLGWMDNYDFNI